MPGRKIFISGLTDKGLKNEDVWDASAPPGLLQGYISEKKSDFIHSFSGEMNVRTNAEPLKRMKV